MRTLILAAVFFGMSAGSRPAAGAVYNGTPGNYASRISRLKPGDVLNLAAGRYAGMTIKDLHGLSSNWIVITGPASGAPAVIVGSACCNTVEILNSSFVSIENLTIDSKGIEGTFGVSAKDGLNNHTHDIRIQNDRFIGQGGSQQTVAISTKTPTWGWVIRGNRISGAGTGIYLGNSDGRFPFIAGVIENNLIEDTIGYNLQIKWQRQRPLAAGMPAEPSVTIIRNNVFVKDDRPSPDGDRPNVLVGGFPPAGPGSNDRYEVYGNFFFSNPREALLQASGRVSIHDNIFVGQDTGLTLQAQDLPLKMAHVYQNTIYVKSQGILFGTAATEEDAVTGNLIFSAAPLTGPAKHVSGNVTDTFENAGKYVKSPSLDPAAMDFYPLPGQCQGAPLYLRPFAEETDYALDFNGQPKESPGRGFLFRGAYSGEGGNPGWKLQIAQKNAVNPAPAANTAAGPQLEISPSTAKRGGTGVFLIALHASKASEIASLQWEMSIGSDLVVNAGDIIAGSAAEAAGKSLTCSAPPGKPVKRVCMLAGGQARIPEGAIAIVHYQVGRKATPDGSMVRVEAATGVTADLKTVNLGSAEGGVSIQ